MAKMSQTAPGPGWWLASDGRWYPPEQAAPPATLPPLSAPPMALPAFPAFGSVPAAMAQPSTGLTPAPGATAYGVAGYGPAYPAPLPQWPGPGGTAYGTAYPRPLAQWSDAPIPKTSRMAIWALILVILFAAVGALAGIPMAFVARSRIRKSGGALKGSGLALAALIVGFFYMGLVLVAIAIPTFLGVTHSGPSVQNLEYSVQNQISGNGPNDFDATGVTSVSCQRPSSWTTGSTFTCVAFNATGSEVGTYYGTVEPNVNGIYSWYGRYRPLATS
jgi:Domain of unknown function (DUF4190)